jgi:hypothetical protein
MGVGNNVSIDKAGMGDWNRVAEDHLEPTLVD